MRSIVYRLDDLDAFCRLFERERGELRPPAPSIEAPGGPIVDGEWVLAIFQIGGRATASAARGIVRDGATFLAFETRDWERLQGFGEAKSERMRAARPSGTLPAVRPSQLPPRPSFVPAPLGPGEERWTGDVVPRVLFVDDDDAVRAVVGAMLGALGLDVAAATSAEEALDEVDRAPCDLLVVDWNLPGMTGLELCRRLRQRAASAQLPVLFLTAHASPRDEDEAFACGADDYVVKPFRAPELGARIFGLLRRAKGGTLRPPPVAPKSSER